MNTRRLAIATALALFTAACGGDKNPNSPTTTPTPPPAANRTIELGGPLDFGNVQIGQTVERELRINNRGTSPLTVTGFTGPAGFTASWTNGTVPAGGLQASIIRFTPTEAKSYGGTLTVSGDHTAGSNTIQIAATGVTPPRPQFTRTGIGNTVFDMPKDVSRLRIIGIYNQRSSNFVVKVANRLVVNEIIGTNTPFTIGSRYQGDHVVPSECKATAGATCVVTVEISTGVEWSFEELR